MKNSLPKFWVRKYIFVIILLALLFSVFGAGNIKPALAQSNTTSEISPSLIVNINTDQAAYSANENVIVHVAITNPGSEAVKILKWFTPLTDSTEPLLNVSVDGQPVAYIGAIYKRADPTQVDYITLNPGETLNSDVNLADYYDLSVTGIYSVSFNIFSDSLYLGPETGRKLSVISGSLVSNNLDLSIEGHLLPASLTASTDLFAASGSNSFNACTSSRQTDITNARSYASTYASDALTYFNNGQTGPRYTYWFGTYDSARYNTVKSHYSSIKNVTDTAAMNFDCTCADTGVYAYVYPNQPYNIYLCGAFWSAPTSGADSKAGTLIHEISHFDNVAGTDDVVYGYSGSHNLAVSNPASAITNADSHEYFAENTPSLETTNGGGTTTYSISGNAGVAGATLTYTDSIAKTATADSNGNYTITIPSGWAGTVTPSKSGYSFTPSGRSYSNVTSNQASQNYTATANSSSNGTNLIQDPSFEAFTTNSPWVQTSTNFGTPLCDAACGTDNSTALPRTGNIWAWFGGISADESGSLSQNVTFPNGGTATLQFYFWVGYAGSGSDANDVFNVKIDNNTIFTANATQQSSYPAYTLVTLDISSYANGAAHTVRFDSTTTTQYVTFNVDDVSLTGTGGSAPTIITKSFASVGAYDGHVLEYTETSNTGGSLNAGGTTFFIGDNATDKQYRAFLHFDTSGLPDNAVITSITLKIKKQSLVGTTPFNTHGALLVDVRKPYFGSGQALANADFQAAASAVSAASISSTPSNNWYSATNFGNTSFSYINLTGPTQFRLRFQKDDNDDMGADYFAFYSGNYGTASLRPQLVIQYYVP